MENNNQDVLISSTGRYIPIQENEKFPVNTKDVYDFLAVKSRYNDWISNSIKKYDFLENIDYILVTKNLVTRSGGTTTKEYICTLDMAKELCMVSKTKRGKDTRKYFLAIEAKYKQVQKAYQDYLTSKKSATVARKEFTAVLKELGITKPADYICLTLETKRQFKIALNRNKETYSTLELKKTDAVESLARLKMAVEQPQDFNGIYNIITESSSIIEETTRKADQGYVVDPCYIIDQEHLTPRQNINKLINYVAGVLHTDAQNVRNLLYSHLAPGVNLYELSKKRGYKLVIDYLEKHHDLDVVLEKGIKYFSKLLYDQKMITLVS